MISIANGLDEVGQLLVDALTKELIGQNHKATGRLIQSIEHVVLTTGTGWDIQVNYNNYGSYLETGIRASRFKKPAGRNEINGLISWIKAKGLSQGDKKDKSFAFAIAKKHRKSGFPAKGYSNNGRTTGFQTYVLEQEYETIREKIDGIVTEGFQIQIDQYVFAFNKNRKL
jgi:hypothetical protein